ASAMPRRSAFVENVVALIVLTLALAVFICLAAIAPVVWTFASDAASQTRTGLFRGSSIEDAAARLACYDEIARRPPRQTANGANALPRGRQSRARSST